MGLSIEKRYDIAIDLYKHYNDIILKGTAFLYSLISGLIAFFIANQNSPKIDLILILAFFTGIASIILFIISILLLKNVKVELEELSNKLELIRYPSIRPICWFLRANIVGMTLLLCLGYSSIMNK